MNLSHDCAVIAVCQNIPGGYNCTCEEGYFGNGTNCADMDECAGEAITIAGGILDTGYDS